MQEQHLAGHCTALVTPEPGRGRGFGVDWSHGGTQGAVSCSGQESGAGQELGTPGDELHTQGQAQAHCRAQQGLAPSHDAGDPRLGPVGLSPAASDVNH